MLVHIRHGSLCQLGSLSDYVEHSKVPATDTDGHHCESKMTIFYYAKPWVLELICFFNITYIFLISKKLVVMLYSIISGIKFLPA